MSIYLRPGKSKYWWYRFKVSGREYRGSTFTEDEQEAKDYEAAEYTKLTGTITSSSSIDQAFDVYYQLHAYRLASAKIILLVLSRFVKCIGPNTALCDVSTVHFLKYVAERKSANYKNSSCNCDVAKIRTTLNWLTQVYNLKDMPSIHWAKIRLPEPRPRVRSLSEDEIVRLFVNLREDFHPFVWFALLSGARVGNIIKLKWTDIGPKFIVFREFKSRSKEEIHTIPITDNIRKVLDYVKDDDPEYVFTYINQHKKKRTRFSRNGWFSAWKKSLKAAGIADFTFHDNRHTAATKLLKKCRNLQTVRRLLGHSRITTTARYAHVLDDDLRDEMEDMYEDIPSKVGR